MSKNGWTPGPWVVDREWPNNKVRGHTAISGSVGKPNEHRAMVQVVTSFDGDPYRQGDANARLIAAAPELAEALSDFLENPLFQVGVGGNPNAVDAMLSSARLALSKARGET